MPTNYSGDASAFPTTIPVPADGEPASEAILAPAWKKEADRSAYLYRKLPLVSTYAYANPSAGTVNTAGVTLWTYGNSYALENTVVAGAYLDVANCLIGDKIQVTCFGNYVRSGTSLGTAFNAFIDAIDHGVAAAHVPGAAWTASSGVPSSYGGATLQFSLGGIWQVTAAGTTRFAFAFQSGNWGTDVFKITSAFNIIAIRLPA